MTAVHCPAAPVGIGFERSILTKGGLRIDPYIWVLDLSSEFNMSKISNISTIPQIMGYKKSPEMPWVDEGIMWAARNGSIYETGGYVAPWTSGPIKDPPSRRQAVWSFNPTTGEWGLVQTNGDYIDRVSQAAYASAPNLDLHFSIGGITTRQHQAENTDYPQFDGAKVNNGMTIFNSSSLSLRNRTLEDLAQQTNTMPARKNGWCTYIPVGARGMLVCHSRCTGPRDGQYIYDMFSSPDEDKTLNVCSPLKSLRCSR